MGDMIKINISFFPPFVLHDSEAGEIAEKFKEMMSPVRKITDSDFISYIVNYQLLIVNC